jgi:hypothetical protein
LTKDVGFGNDNSKALFTRKEAYVIPLKKKSIIKPYQNEET